MFSRWMMIPAVLLTMSTTAVNAGDLRVEWIGGSVIIRGCLLGAMDEVIPANPALPANPEEPIPPEPMPPIPEVKQPVPAVPPLNEPARRLNVLRNSGNGYGNTIIVDNGTSGGNGVTIVDNVRNGIGNKLIVTNPGQTIIVGGKMYPREGFVWTHKQYSNTMRSWLYWSARDRSWFRYDSVNDRFQAVPLDLLFDEDD